MGWLASIENGFSEALLFSRSLRAKMVLRLLRLTASE